MSTASNNNPQSKSKHRDNAWMQNNHRPKIKKKIIDKSLQNADKNKNKKIRYSKRKDANTNTNNSRSPADLSPSSSDSDSDFQKNAKKQHQIHEFNAYVMIFGETPLAKLNRLIFVEDKKK
eukprot:297229_1